MMQKDVTVSIGMPVFNDKPFLKKALDSLLQQTHKDFELIISDDGSTDGSEDICREYAQIDDRIVYIRQNKTLGISKNMEFLLKKAHGEYFMWAADDDVWHPQFIELLIQALSNNKYAIVAFCPYVSINEEDNIIKEYPIHKNNYQSISPAKRLIALTQKWDDSFGYGLFIRNKILNVRFPVWWWINNNCAYNNIYPTLYYYLTLGDFTFVDGNPLWFNRLKPNKNINHNIPYDNTFIRGFLAFLLRRFNLFYKCIESIISADIYKSYLIILVLPFILKRAVIDLKSSFLIGCQLYIKGIKSFW